MFESPYERRTIEALAGADGEILLLRQPLPQQEITQQRYQREREDERTDERRSHRHGHRRENSTLVPLQSEDGDMRRDDDQHREEGRPPHLHGRPDYPVAQRFALVLLVAGAEIADG